uniref:Histone-lysine N-methyltransferase n=1 Tax=Mastacembelus armatus TaxID=205130 RepID=A0A3Q3RZY9_9TELE
MAHSCRWRFPARPGGSSNSGTGRRAGRIRVTASLRSVSGAHPNAAGLGHGFDAALQVSSVIGSNLQKFRHVLGESSDSSSGEEEAFGGFGTVAEQNRVQSPTTTFSGIEKKPRGRPPRALTAQKAATIPSPTSLPSPTQAKPEDPERPAEKVKRLPGRPPGTGERRGRGRPPSSSSKKAWSTGSHAAGEDIRQAVSELGIDTEEDKDRKGSKRMPLGSAQSYDPEAKLPKGGRGLSKVGNLKRLRATKLAPLKSRLKTLPGVPRRRRGRPPSAERLKAKAAAAAAAQLSTSIECGEGKSKAFRVRGGDKGTELHTSQQPMVRNVDGPEDQDSSNPPASPSPSKPGRTVGLRKSPRHIKPVRIVPPSKRTDATIAKQLLQRAKKGAQKRLEKEAVAIGGSGAGAIEAGIRKTPLKNIRQFIMPVVSTVSLRIIKTPKRFIEDEGSFGTPPPHMKIPRLETTPSSVLTSAQPTSTTSSSHCPVLVSSTSAVTSTGTTAPTDSLPPPPPPAPVPPVPSTAASLINSNTTNNATNGRFSSSAASCGSSAVSQHSSQLSSAESSRSSSPSLDDSSCDSQASEATQVLSEAEDHSPSSQGEREANLLHSSQSPSPPSEPEAEQVLAERSRRGRRGQGLGRGSQIQRVRETLTAGSKKPIISPPTGVLMSSSTLVNSQQTSSTASSPSSPPPPPLLTPPQPPQSASSNTAAISEHHPQSPWMPHTIPPFLSGPSVIPSLQDKRSRSILREPTFRWTSLSHPEQQYFSSAKYAKEGLIRKPIFDNFRPPPLTAEDVGLLPQSVSGAGGAAPVTFPAPGSGAGTGTRLFAPLHPHTHHQHPSSSRFDAPLQKRSPLLRAPRFTPSEAHSRIFESVTLHSSSGSSPGSLSPHQTSPSSSRTSRRRRRPLSGTVRGHPRSPSHSMTRRSSHIGSQMSVGKGASEMSVLTGTVSSTNPSSLPGVSASPLATSALTPASFSTFSTVSLGLALQGTPDSRRGASGNPPSLSTTSSASSPLFPLFPSSAQDTGRGCGKGGKEKSLSAPQEAAPKEKERDSEKNREKEKENKREGRKDLEKRSKVSTPDGSPNAPSSLFTVDGRDSEDALLPLAPKKTPGRKKSTSVDVVTDPVSSEVRGLHSSVPISIAKVRVPKKGRPSEKGGEMEDGEKEKEKQSVPSQQTASLPGQPGRTQLPVTSLGSMLAQAEKQPVTDKRVFKLLKKAKDQLIDLKKSKLKPADQTKVQGQESDSSETSVRGPRIKHVCRRAAVALGRNRAVFPDDMPTLSALPWEEREKILSSMGNDDKSSVAGSEEAEPQSPPIKPRETRQKAVQEAPPKKGRRSRRCGQCSGCQVPEDCGVCTNCLDKPKFGGRNIKKQCCKMRKCQNLQWMPSKMFLQKQGKVKKEKKKNKVSEKKEGPNLAKGPNTESGPKSSPAPPKEEPPRKKSETPPLKLGEEKSRQQPASKQSSPALASSPAPAEPPQTPSTVTAQAQAPALTPDSKHEPKKKPQEQSSQQQSSATPLTTKPPSSSTLNWLGTPSTRGQVKSRAPCDGVHRIRVDFKRDHDVEKVWEAGGLNLLTSVPVTPRVLCFLCASSGNVEFVFCQVCCEPFHLFCLGESERPLQEQIENWCCRRCRFCQVCGRQHQKTKQLLECDKCRNSYHPECLGPNHPTRPTKKKRVWVCTKCVRCTSCGATKPGKSWDAQWSHDFSMCHDCAKLFAKGNFCPLCDKCYDDDNYDSKMMECGRCNHWVHAKCENLTDEMYELLSKLPESVAYTCTKCTEHHPAEWRTALERELQGCIRHVLTALLNSRTSTHLLRYRQAVKPPELNPETEESLPSRRSPEGPDPPVLTEVPPTPPSDSPPDLESVEKKMDQGRYKSVLEFSDDIVRIIQAAINNDGGHPESRKANSIVKSFFIRQMERIFPWFKVKESRFWERQKVSANSGLLPNAVLPPSLDHNYAQWQQRQELSRAEHPHLMKKIIPAPRPKTPGEPDSPASPPQVPPAITPPPLLLPDCEDSPELPPPPGVRDNRQCVLCLKYGDENINEGGRLLYIGQNEWTHVNCALWSAEVFEDDDGSLKNVHMAVLRGRQLRCEKCQKPGATVGCCLTSCTSNYHFMCARQCHCVFLEDKKVYCPKHRDLIKGEVVSGFEVTRRVLVDLEGVSLRRKWQAGLEPENVHMMIGSMTIDCLGILTELSDCKRKLFPVGYQCSRVYWSTLDARKRCVYTCRILVCHPPVVESDVKSKMAPEENRTIAHSTSPVADFPDPFESPRRSDTLSPANTPKLRVYTRNRHPSYPPCQRSVVPRPIPFSGTNPQNHEIVTVGASLMNPGIRNIDSRRHSSPSLSPPPHHLNRQRGASRESSNREADKCKSTSRDPSYKDMEKAKTLSRDSGLRDSENQSKQAGGESKSPRLAPAGSGQSSPPVGTAVLTGQQRGGSTKQTGRQGKHGGKDQDVSGSLGLLQRHRSTPTSNIIQPKDKPSSGKDSSCATGNLLPSSHHKDSVIGKSSSPQASFQKSSARKSNDYSTGLATGAVKPPWPLRTPVDGDIVKQGPMHLASSAAASAAKDKHSKVKAGSREVSKVCEREKTLQNSNSGNKIPILNNNTKASGSSITHASNPSSHNSSNSKAPVLGNSTKTHGKAQGEKHDNQGGDRSSSKSRENYSCSERKNSSSLDNLQQLQQAGLLPEKGLKTSSHSHTKQTTNQLPLSSREKKRSVTPSTGTPLKTELKTGPNGTSAAGGICTSSCSSTTTSTFSPPDQGTRRPARSALFSSPSASSSDSSESDTQTQTEEDDLHKDHSCSQLQDHHNLLTQGTEDEGDGPEDDHDRGMDDKHHEDDSDGSGSAKRRYPRRSARARSNMFFGLTHLYGIRSYGEEDLPFSGVRDGAGAMVKRRTGGRKKSAEGQVDGADDMSTSSSSGDSGEDEDSGMKQRGKDPYYYNFTRTIINRGEGLPSIEGIDQCLGRGSQLQRFLKDEEQQQQRAQGNQHIGQLDGIDDGSESDTSICTTSTTTTTATSSSTPHKSTPKRRGRERHIEKLDDSSKEADSSGGAVSGNTREGRKNQKENCLPLGVKSQPQSHGQDPLETQLSLSTDLLKSDSDNNNSDDCGNILPSDIMEFVLNTPSMSMQALGQQSEPSSSELLLDESYVGVDVNRRKDILFEDFSQPLPSAEGGGVVESSVNSSMSVEEPYLPLELPSDLSVLTTRSPAVSTSQNHTAGSLISDTSERTMLGLTSDPETISGEKSGDKKRAGPGVSPSENQHDTTTLGNRDTQVTEGHMTPEQFIPSPAIGQVVEPPGNQDVPRGSGTPGLPSSPSLPLQGQKYLPAAAAGSPSPVSGPGPSQAQVSSPAVIKPGPDKLIVVNQQFQPLYVFQTVPNGVTQKLSATGVMDTSSPAVLSSMTLTTGLNTGLSPAQPIFPAGGKVLGTMPHPSQIHTFTGAAQAGFPTGIPSTTSGLLIGLPSHTHDQSQILVSEAGRPHELGPSVAIVSSPSSLTSSPTVLASAHGRKRPISRLQPRKNKKLARSRSQPTLAPSEVGPPNMTLINLSSPQITASIPGQPGGLVELSTLSASQRKVPNIIKRPKSGGVMYLDPTTLLQSRIPGSAQPGILGHDSSTHLLPCSVSGLNPSQSVLNVVSVPPSGATGILAPGSVSLSTPVLSSAEITGPISNLLFKASQHGLGLSDQPVVLQSAGGAPLMSQLSSPVQTSISSSICVLPSQQTISMAVNQQVETEGSNVHLQHQSQPVNRAQTVDPSPSTKVTLAPGPATSLSPAKGRVVGVFSQTQTSAHSQSSRTTPISRSSEHRPGNSNTVVSAAFSGSGAEKGKQKVKRSRQSLDLTSGKKLKASQTEDHHSNPAGRLPSNQRSKELSSPEPMDTGKPPEKAANRRYGESLLVTHFQMNQKHRVLMPHIVSSMLGKKKTSEGPVLPGKVVGKDKPATARAGSLLVASPPDQDGNSMDTSLDSKPKKGIIFEICSEDGFHIRCESIEEAWKSLTDKVKEARANARLKELSFEGVNALRMLGVVHEAVVFLLEQLYGSRHCRSYRFRFHKPEETNEPPINPHGSARAEIHHRRSVFDMFNFLASKHRQPPEYRPQEDDDEEGQLRTARRTSMELPLTVRFKQLKATSKETVGVYRSPIHGRGLFCKKTIDAGEMVIEYSGNVIRSVLTDKREKYYDGKGIGCYMFRIDDYEVVDATVHGNAARFINHSCEPNCYSRVITVDGQKHIVIFASRRIYCGEELTYDYKFPIEDASNKLLCNCGAKKCRKFLN